MSIYKKSLEQIHECPELIFDFSELKSSDSSGLALIIEWIKLSKRCNKSIRFIQVSKDILSLAKAAGVDNIIFCH